MSELMNYNLYSQQTIYSTVSKIFKSAQYCVLNIASGSPYAKRFGLENNFTKLGFKRMAPKVKGYYLKERAHYKIYLYGSHCPYPYQLRL